MIGSYDWEQCGHDDCWGSHAVSQNMTEGWSAGEIIQLFIQVNLLYEGRNMTVADDEIISSEILGSVKFMWSMDDERDISH